MKRNTSETMTAGGALLARLKAVGVDYIFANSGTDFPPIIEGLAEAQAKGLDLPSALVIPHENAAMGMAHGYYLATGRAQAVFAHTNVGLANCAIGAINAATEHIPLLLFSGRTPVSEAGRLGSRTVPIGWGQEMRDQSALVREATKWDYELRYPEQITSLVDRAYAIANSTPKGPVYLSLPREVLCESVPAVQLNTHSRISPASAAPDRRALDEALHLISHAQRPVIIAQRGAGSTSAFESLSQIALDWGIPVVSYWAIQLALPTDHPMSVGENPSPWIEEADVIIVIDALAPWSPAAHQLGPCKVIHVGPNPLYSRFPVRDFQVDVALVGETADSILALAEGLSALQSMYGDICASRRKKVADYSAEYRSRVRDMAERGGQGEKITKDFVSLCLSNAIQHRHATVLSELGCPFAPLNLREPGSWYQEPHSGGLGWSFPAALGMQLADRNRLIVATMGDGSYMFANPVACHQIAESLRLPLLILVLNNAEWAAVRHSVTGVYPDGYAASAATMPLTSLSPSPDFVKVAQASRAWARRVEQGKDLPDALRAALHHIASTGTHALLEVSVV